MLMDRIIKAFTFKREVYAEVEHDTSFTGTAWTLVAVVAFLNQLGAYADGSDTGGWILGTLVGTVGTVFGFAVGAWVIAWLGKAMFQAEVTFDEMVRTLGLAYVWTILGAINVLVAFVPLLDCILWLPLCAAWLLALASMYFATREALDLDDGSTLITVVVGFIVMGGISLATGLILGLLGLAGSAISGAISS